MASIHLQPGKPNWFCYFTTPDGKRHTKSTRTRNKQQATVICRAWQKGVRAQKAKSLNPEQAQEIIAKGVVEIRALDKNETTPSAELPVPTAILIENRIPKPRRITLTDIAREAGVSHVTVSLALRSHPRISTGTRQKIQALAKRLGYRPDPALSALNAYRREARPFGAHETLAWINVWPEAHRLREIYSYYWEGALERCEDLGYKLEEFRLVDYGMRAARLSQVLQARGIRGVLVPPQFRNRTHLKLGWEHFTAIAFGYTLAQPQLHLVTNAQFRSVTIAMRALRRMGHRRIGFVLERNIHERTDHNYAGSYLAEQLRYREADRIPVFLLPNNSAAVQKKFGAWYHRHQPESILTANFQVEAWMLALGYLEKRDYSLVMLDVHNERHGGIDQNGHTIGRTAVDLLVGMLYRNERGIPRIPQRTLIEGHWVEGQTIRRLVSSMRKAK